MNNKKVIRKNLQEGKFTTIHNSILLDNRLSPTAFRLLVTILSDSDTKFDLSQTLYCKRLAITKPTFIKAIKNLENCGYLKKTENKINKTRHYYIISEFGNLYTHEDHQPIEQVNIIQPMGSVEMDKPSDLSVNNIFEEPLFELNDYIDLIQGQLNIRKTTVDVSGLNDFLNSSAESGELNNASQLTIVKINKLIDSFVIINPPTLELSEADVKVLCEKHRPKVLKSKYNDFVDSCISSFNNRIQQGKSLNNFSGAILGISIQEKFKKKEKVDYETYISEREND